MDACGGSDFGSIFDRHTADRDPDFVRRAAAIDRVVAYLPDQEPSTSPTATAV